ncbi:phage tail tape measure protein [Flavobacterium sp. AED]|uniref:phage tail tape measure protein n=1 Tax=Flavobacterium sp. AED TaxID=1423323 RepID=UPI00068D4802|nr:phage tail tape measure protein [Flavobacterium sp. AED]
MNNVFNYIFKITSDAQKVTAGMDKLNASVDKIQSSTVNMDATFKKSFGNMQRDIATIKLSSILDQVDRVANGLNTLNKPGMDLSTNMYDLQAITGVAGDKLKEIEGYARQSAKTFGGSAADGVESYKLILSKLSPEIAKVPTALQDMGKNVAITSKLMGGDTVAATDLLTTAMNQYQVSTADPLKASKEMAVMMNTMAAGAKEGSAELPEVKAALEQSGMAAKGANVHFAETNAAIQVLDKAGKKGAEGGVALRNMLATLSEGRFLPKDVKAELASAGVSVDTLGNKNLTLADRMKPLRKIMGDSALVTKLFGKENSNAAIALISGIDEQERLTKAITGTNTAYEQAAIVMESPAEKNKRLQAQIDDFKISLFNGTNGMMAYASIIGDTTRDFSNMVPLISGAGKVLSFLTSATKMQAAWTSVVTGAQWLWNAAMTANPIVLIIAGVIALIAVVATIISYWDQWGAAMSLLLGPIGFVISAIMTFKDHWDSIVNAFNSGGIIGGLKRIGVVMLDVLLKPVQQLLELIAKIPGLGGIAGSGAASIKSMRAKMDLITPGEVQTKALKKANGIAAPIVPGTATSGGTGKGTPAGGSKTKGNEAVATGGTKNTVINITLKDLIGVLNIQGKDFKDSSQQMAEQSQDALLRLLAMATTAGN